MAQAPPPPYANFEPAQTNPIRLSADGTRLFAVNTPNNSLSVFDVTAPASPSLIAQIPVGLGPVSVNSLSDDQVWVVNQVSNSISVVSVSAGIVTSTIRVPVEPMDVVFAGPNQAYVSASRLNQIDVFDTVAQTLIKTIPVFGGNPRALAVSPDGSKVYAAFAVAGNASTIIPQGSAPPQCGAKGAPQCVPAMNPALPPPPPAGLIVAASDPNWKSYVTFTMPDNGVAIINTGASPSLAGYYSNVGTVNLGLAVNPANGDVFVSNTAALNLINFEPNVRGHIVNNRITHIQVANGTVTPVDLNPNIDYSVLPNPQALSTALSQPAGVVFDPSGNFMYVASFGTDRVAQVDTNGNVLSFVEVGPPSGQGSNVDPIAKRGPRGLALNGSTLYSMNRISDTISIINASAMAVTGEIAVGTDPEPATVKAGRGFLYDGKLSGNGTNSCASCHVDGEMDHLAWNLGDPTGDMTVVVQDGNTFKFHPMKGPMTTQTLRGLLNLFPYHWRGDKPNFAAFNGAFNGLMGGPQLSDSDMAAFTNYVNTILFLPNPNENLDRTLPTSFNKANPANGFNIFVNSPLMRHGETCNSCHTANPGSGSNRLIKPNSPQSVKVPELREIYQKLLYSKFQKQNIDGFGLSHEGAHSGLLDFLNGASFANYSKSDKEDIAAYEMCFDTGTAPAVGYTQTLTPANVTSAPVQSAWALLQSQAAAGNNDLIGRGTINKQLTGLLYQPVSGTYISNTNAVYTQQQVQAFVAGGDTMSVMGVYPGTGTTQ
jgi:YVTN family beta-propeller protein